MTDEEAQLADRFEVVRGAFLQGFLKAAQQALQSGDLELARQLLIDKDEALYAPLRDVIVQLTGLQTRVAKEEYDAAQSLYQVIFAVAVGSIIAGVLLGVLLRSEEHTSELQSPCNLVCRLLLEKKNT